MQPIESPVRPVVWRTRNRCTQTWRYHHNEPVGVPNEALYAAPDEATKVMTAMLRDLRALTAMQRKHYGLDGAWDNEMVCAAATIRRVEKLLKGEY